MWLRCCVLIIEKKNLSKGYYAFGFTNCALPLLFSQYIVLQKVDKSWTKELDQYSRKQTKHLCFSKVVQRYCKISSVMT